ncbi:hypothetical protein Dsin_015629 [Dipteronia sinensis]|uniref:Retrotransposon gag domain-containing protein n=1 Tax=Dipteronia sinensis TaxID=43782 RepID=A0AAE0E658_9ROSI|nr:hypothetical protein Dsin_015629 [Dipteronia sinensis]
MGRPARSKQHRRREKNGQGEGAALTDSRGRSLQLAASIGKEAVAMDDGPRRESQRERDLILKLSERERDLILAVEKNKGNFWRCKDMVLSWILNSVHSDIAESVIYAKTVAEVWNDLKERFSQGNDSRIYQILLEIVKYKQGQESVSGYYTKLKALWDELASYNNPITCSRGGLKSVAEREENERVMQFSIGLNESYATVPESILMMNPLPDTRKAHALVLQQERNVDVASKRETNSGHLAKKAAHSQQTTQASPTTRSFITQENRTSKKTLKCTSATEPTRGSNPEGAIFTTEEYNQLMALLRKQNGNDQAFVNAIGAEEKAAMDPTPTPPNPPRRKKFIFKN